MRLTESLCLKVYIFNYLETTLRYDDSIKQRGNTNHIKENRTTGELGSKMVKKDTELKGFDVKPNHKSYGKTPD
jgi:hypothetical protein